MSWSRRVSPSSVPAHGLFAMKALLIAVSIAAPAVGQIVTAAAVVSQPITATVVDANGIPTSQTIAAGTALPGPFALVTPGANVGLAVVTFGCWSSRNEAIVQVIETNNAVSARSASVGPCDLLCSFSSSVATQVRLEVRWDVRAPTGSAMPLADVDVGNDGTFEFQGRILGLTTIAHLTLGTTPLVVRLRTQSATTSGIVQNMVQLRIVPDPTLTLASSGPSCGGEYLSAMPAFDGALDLDAIRTASSFRAVRFLVLGLAATPVTLPPPSSCLLIPRPDAVVQITGTFHLPSARLRGVPLWLQAVACDFYVGASEPISVLYQ